MKFPTVAGAVRHVLVAVPGATMGTLRAYIDAPDRLIRRTVLQGVQSGHIRRNTRDADSGAPEYFLRNFAL